MLGLIALILICFFFSVFFSATEMAFISSNKLKLKRLMGEGNRSASIIDSFNKHPRNFLAAILLGNHLMNVSIAALSVYLLYTRFGVANETVITLVVAPFLIIFAESIPKDFGWQKADQVIYKMARVLNVFYKGMIPLSTFMLGLTERLLNLFGSYEKKSPFVTKEEFHFLINESARQGIIQEHEKKLVDTILNFEKIRVEEVMVPLSRAPQIEFTQKVGDLKQLVRKNKAIYVLVYEEIPSIIVGAIYTFDTLFEKDDNKALTFFLKPPLFVSKNVSAEKVFLKLQENHQSFAVVLDEDSEAVGVVSMDNLLAL